MRIRLGIWADTHWGRTPDGRQTHESCNLQARQDIYDNIPVDVLVLAGDNIDGVERYFASFKTFLEHMRHRGIVVNCAEGNHDPQLYGNIRAGGTHGEDHTDGQIYWGSWWWTNYPYAETRLAEPVTAGDTFCRVVSSDGFSSLEPQVFFVEPGHPTPTGGIAEGKWLDRIDYAARTLHFRVPFQNSFGTINTKIMQGRDKVYLYNLLRDTQGAGHPDLGQYGLSRIHVSGNNAFVTLGYETFYDNPVFPNPAKRFGYQNYTSNIALTWLEQQLQRYPNHNFFITTHAAPTGCGLDYLGLVEPDYRFNDGNSDRIKQLCLQYKIVAWFTGHRHWCPGTQTHKRFSVSQEYGGTAFVGAPALPRDGLGDLPYAQAKIWWHYLEIDHGATAATLRLRNSSDYIWENDDKIINLAYPAILVPRAVQHSPSLVGRSVGADTVGSASTTQLEVVACAKNQESHLCDNRGHTHSYGGAAIVSTTYTIKRGDTWPIISAQLLHQGAAINLLGASVRLVARSGTKRIDRPAVVTNALEGRVTCALTAADVIVAGHYHAEFEVTFAGGEVTTVPNDGYFSLVFIGDL